MATQMSSARRGVATDEMKQVAKDEDVTLDWLLPKIASGSIKYQVTIQGLKKFTT